MPKAKNQILVDQINKRMDEIKSRDTVIGTDNMTMTQLQQNACRELYAEMVAEGLRTTAKTILKYVELGPNQEIVETSNSFRIIHTSGVISKTNQRLIGEIGPEMIMEKQRCIGRNDTDEAMNNLEWSEPSDGATVHINITDEDLGIK